jgi:hypothetical protein
MMTPIIDILFVALVYACVCFAFSALRWLSLRVVGLLLVVSNILLLPVLWLPFGERVLSWLIGSEAGWDSLDSIPNITPAFVAQRGEFRGVVAGKSVTGHLAEGRPRLRARWTRALQEELGGRFGVVGEVMRGRWVPDLPSYERSDVANYLLSSVEDGARILGGGFEEVADDFGADGVYFIVETSGSRELVFPALLGAIRQYALFRKRDSSLLLGLRSRASEWCKARGFRPWVADMAVCSAAVLAMSPSAHEVLSRPRVELAIERSSLLKDLA